MLALFHYQCECPAAEAADDTAYIRYLLSAAGGAVICRLYDFGVRVHEAYWAHEARTTLSGIVAAVGAVLFAAEANDCSRVLSRALKGAETVRAELRELREQLNSVGTDSPGPNYASSPLLHKG